MNEWKCVDDELPEKTGRTWVAREVHNFPTAAIFVSETAKWMVMLDGQYWEITGVKYWRQIKKKPWKELEP